MKEIIKVEGMSCNHCVQSITEALMQLNYIENVNIDLESKEVEISYNDEINLEEVKSIIDDLGFEVI